MYANLWPLRIFNAVVKFTCMLTWRHLSYLINKHLLMWALIGDWWWPSWWWWWWSMMDRWLIMMMTSDYNPLKFKTCKSSQWKSCEQHQFLKYYVFQIHTCLKLRQNKYVCERICIQFIPRKFKRFLIISCMENYQYAAMLYSIILSPLHGRSMSKYFIWHVV